MSPAEQQIRQIEAEHDKLKAPVNDLRLKRAALQAEIAKEAT